MLDSSGIFDKRGARRHHIEQRLSREIIKRGAKSTGDNDRRMRRTKRGERTCKRCAIISNRTTLPRRATNRL
jgi:hypothetical protein